MNTIKSKTKLLILILAVFLLVAFFCFLGVFIYNHPTSLKYNDRWIKGKNRDQITVRYGDFADHDEYSLYSLSSNESKFKEGTTREIYLLKEKSIGFLGTYPPEFYVIEFDENGFAYNVYTVSNGPRGG